MQSKLRPCLAVLFTVLIGCGLAAHASDESTETGANANTDSAPDVRMSEAGQKQLAEILRTARRIPNSSKWFETIALPNDVYALWEPGHMEKVNSFLITGSEKDVLYDTGMGIASIGKAVAELRAVLGREDVPLMVINSHNHLDHNGGNADFSEAWIIKHEWAIRKLTEGVRAGPNYDWVVEYWSDLTPHEGVEVPKDFDPETFSIPPFPLEGIRYLADGDIVDLGNRQFRAIHLTSHSPDGLALYDEENQVFFGGDTLGMGEFLVINMDLLIDDLDRVKDMPVKWFYAQHGDQLVQTMQEERQLAIVRRIRDGEREESVLRFAGQDFVVYTLDNVDVIMGGDFLTY